MSNKSTILLEYAGEKPLRMSQLSRKIDLLPIVFWQGSCSTNLGFAILLLRIDQPLQSLHIV